MHAVHRYHTIVAIRDFSSPSLPPRAPRLSRCGRENRAAVMMRKQYGEGNNRGSFFGPGSARAFSPRTVLFHFVPRRRAYIRPRTFDLRGLDGIPWMRNVIPYTTPPAPRSFSRPVTSGHITTPRPMWNFAFQSCPRSNKRWQLPKGNIFSAKGWAIYLERKRLDTSGSTEESESMRIPQSLLRKIHESYYKMEELFIILQKICTRQ